MDTTENIRFIDDVRWNASLLTVDFSVDVRNETRGWRVTCRAPRDIIMRQFADSGKEQPLELFKSNLDAIREAMKRRITAALNKADQFHLLVLHTNDFFK